MEFTLYLTANQQAIDFIDQTMESYTSLYNLSVKREVCFVVHELVINAVEAMRNVGKADEEIQVHVKQREEQLQVTVIDQAEGIPEEHWDSIFQEDFQQDSFLERGRGLLFVKYMVDDLWFEHVSDTQFLVGITKKIVA